MNVDGSNQALLVTDGSQPTWSPEGDWIAFSTYRDEPDRAHCYPGCNREIYKIRTDGTGLTNVTNSPSTERDPDWGVLPSLPGADGYARPRGASPTTLRFVPEFRVCTTGSNGYHGAPLALPSCTPPQQSSAFLTMGTGDSNGTASQFTGRLTMKVVCNPPAPNGGPPCTDAGDQADVKLDAEFIDVRTVTELTDYLGELQMSITLRITDRLNGASGSTPATVVDAPFSFAVPCSGDLDMVIGSTCAVSTTADAVTPGIVPEGKRAIWQVGQVQVFDGGPDGVAATPGNTLFAVPGLFAP
jgi:hypothetical protein